MHVLLIHQIFAGPDDPGGTRHYELGRYLVERGHRFTVITSAVNYLTGGAAGCATDLPRGMRIVRVAGRQDIHRSYRARALAFVRFAAGALRHVPALRNVDVVWGTSPPLVQLLPAWLASLRCPGGLLFEERDLWPEFAVGMGVVREGPLSRTALRFKRFMYARARHVVVNSPGFLPFLHDYDVPANKVTVIPNGVDVAQFNPTARGERLRREWGVDGRFVVLYAGALGPANGLDVVLDAADALRDAPVVFVLAGDGKAKAALVADARRRRLDNVRFVAAQPKSSMPQILAAADACVATLRNIPLFRTTYPNKVFDYLAAGRPVLLGIDGVIRDVIDVARAGTFFPPGDAGALEAAVRELLRAPDEARAMGQRGRAAVCTSFDRSLQGAQIEALLRALVAERRPIPSSNDGSEDVGGITP